MPLLSADLNRDGFMDVDECLLLCQRILKFEREFLVQRMEERQGNRGADPELFERVSLGVRGQVYNGFRPLQATEWKTPAIAMNIISSHNTQDGWALLTTPVFCNGPVCAFEGPLLYGPQKQMIVEVGHVGAPNFHILKDTESRYRAMDAITLVPWMMSPPAPESLLVHTFNFLLSLPCT